MTAPLLQVRHLRVEFPTRRGTLLALDDEDARRTWLPRFAEGTAVGALAVSEPGGRDWADRVEVVEGDATSEADLRRALSGTDVAYYLVHSMDGGGDLARRDRELAEGFAAAASETGVQRIVYLGGLHPEGADLSEHLASRVEVGQILLDGPVPDVAVPEAVLPVPLPPSAMNVY